MLYRLKRARNYKKKTRLLYHVKHFLRPVRGGWLAILLLHIAILMSGVESAFVQVSTSYKFFSFELLSTPSFLLLFALDLLLPLTVALISRRLFMLYLVGHCFLNVILLHYSIFFYNPLTLSSIYHSMQGAASLGVDIFGFARWGIILLMGVLLVIKLLLVRLSDTPNGLMPNFWGLRGVTAACCLSATIAITMTIHGHTGLIPLWADLGITKNAAERRMETGSREAVRHIGYIGTWLGEFVSGTYKDTTLIFAETHCADPASGPVGLPQNTILQTSGALGYNGYLQTTALGISSTAPGCTEAQSTPAVRQNEQNLWQNASASRNINSTASGDASTNGARQNSNKAELPSSWGGLPLPPVGNTVILMQVESLDFAALSMKVNGHTALPFLDYLAQHSIILRAFAPHKVGSSNSDYELLNGRIASQNVIYYSYIKEYPDSILHLLTKHGYKSKILHGLSGELFNLRAAYAAQGFEQAFFKEELLASGYAESKYIMGHILDEDLLDKAEEELHDGAGVDNTNKQAQFIITMTSHIPFIDPLPIFKKAGGVFARYVSSLRYTDQAIAAYYATLPAGTLIIIWGDHGSDVTYPVAFAENNRQVPFFVHVKGDNSWLNAPVQSGPLRSSTELKTPVMANSRLEEAKLHPLGYTVDPPVSSERIFTLCELHYYLRKILSNEKQK